MNTQAELLPISCTGGKFDLIKIPLVTLIDTLDTLVILGKRRYEHSLVLPLKDHLIDRCLLVVSNLTQAIIVSFGVP